MMSKLGMNRPAPAPVRIAKKVEAQESPLQRSRKIYDKFKLGLQIDKDALDDELIEQPQKMLDVCEQHAYAISYRDGVKAEYERLCAEADGAIRRENASAAAAASKAEKLTEAAIKAQIIGDPAVRITADDFADWSLQAALWGGLRSSFEARKSALEKLVNLYTSAYWVSNSGGSTRNDARERIADQVRKLGDVQ